MNDLRIGALWWQQHGDEVRVFAGPGAINEARRLKPVAVLKLDPKLPDWNLDAIVEQTIDAIRKRFDYSDLEKLAP